MTGGASYPPCHGKVTYDKKTALTVKNRRGNQGALLRAYPCPDCNRWHLTKQV